MKKTRIVETAIDENGNSYIFSDNNKAGWELPGHLITDLFFSENCPPNMLLSNHEIKDKNFNLQPGQLRFFRSDIFPTNQVYKNINEIDRPARINDLFYHSTTTVDYVMIAKGEITLIVADKKTILRPGDVVVQRGADHAWHNYTDEVATIMGIMIGVKVPSQFKRVDTVQPT